jgi:hypothetical protein
MRLIGYDTETSRTTRSCLVPPAVCLTLAGGVDDEPPEVIHDTCIYYSPNGEWKGIAVNDAMRPWAEWLVEQDNIVAHRGPYDLAVLSEVTHDIRPALRLLDEHRAHDTAVRESLIEIARGTLQFNSRKKGHFSLAGLVSRYLDIDISDDKTGADRWQINYHKLAGVPLAQWPQDAIDYAIMDAVYARAVWFQQAAVDGYIVDLAENFIDADGFVTDEVRQFRAGLDLHLMACHGPLIDRERAVRTVDSWKSLLAVGEKIATEAGFLRPNGTRDMAKMRELIEGAYTKRGLEVSRTAKGAIQTSREILSSSGDDALEAWGTADEYRNYVVKYADMLLDAEGPLVSRPGTIVATGRCSWSDPPLHGPPREGGFRECFIPREGFVFVSIDYNQIELVCLASFLEAEGFGAEMADAIRAGVDLHCLMGMQILIADRHNTPTGPYVDWTYELFEECKDGVHGAVWKSRVKEYRTLAKALNFGIPGGLGALTFIEFAWKTYRVRLDLDRARQLIAVFKEANPAIKQFHDWVSECCADGSFTMIQASGRYRGGVTFNDGCNTVFQGTASDGIKDASWKIRKLFYDPESALFGSRSWLLLHDELLIEIPEVRLHDAAMLASKIMCDTMFEHTKTIYPKAEPAAMRRWYKEAEPVYDERGRLIPWEPKEEAA